MQVRYDEGVANHIGPEPCAVAREGGGEEFLGEHTAQPLSLVKILIPGADAVASAQTARRGRRTWHVQTLFARKPGDLAIDRSAIAAGPHREGEEP